MKILKKVALFTIVFAAVMMFGNGISAKAYTHLQVGDTFDNAEIKYRVIKACNPDDPDRRWDGGKVEVTGLSDAYNRRWYKEYLYTNLKICPGTVYAIQGRMVDHFDVIGIADNAFKNKRKIRNLQFITQREKKLPLEKIALVAVHPLSILI